MIFRDESKFNIFGSDRYGTIEEKKRRTRKITTYIVKHGGGSVLVWGWMSAVGVGSLKSIHGLVNHKVYIDILKCTLTSSIEKMGIKNNFIFMQNNDPKHIR